jgi:hypothetical protein
MKTVYDTSNQKERSFLKRNDFYDLHSNIMIQTSERINTRTQEATPIFKHKAEAWFTHPRRLQYIDGTIFEPATYVDLQKEDSFYDYNINQLLEYE